VWRSPRPLWRLGTPSSRPADGLTKSRRFRRNRQPAGREAGSDERHEGGPSGHAQPALWPPTRFLAGADTVALAEWKIAELEQQIATHRDLSTSLTFEPEANG
jgi:hypothetical protein